MSSSDTFGAKDHLEVDGERFEIFRLDAVDGAARLPFSLKVLLENLLRTEDGTNTTADDVRALAAWDATAAPATEIQFTPARVILQDFTGVPAVVDLAAMRQAMRDMGGDPQKINPLSSVDLVIDHSVMVDEFGRRYAYAGVAPRLRDGRYDVDAVGKDEWLVEPGLVYRGDKAASGRSGNSSA